MPRFAQMRTINNEESGILLQRAFIDFCRDAASEPRPFGRISLPVPLLKDHELARPAQNSEERLPRRIRKRSDAIPPRR